MNGRPSFERTIRKLKRDNQRRTQPPKARTTVGAWRFEEDANGDLYIIHSETGQDILLARREEPCQSAEDVPGQ